MGTNVLHFLTPKSPTSTTLNLTKPSTTTTKTTHTQILLLRLHSSVRTSAINNSSSSNSSDTESETPPSSPPVRPTITPPNTVEIRFRRRSSRRSRQAQQQDGISDGLPRKARASQPPQPKDWESKTLNEKATELYMGEKGLLFWLNKFAYASIFIMIGAWIVFRFVGPSLNLYQLDAPPLSPSSIFKGSE